MEKFNLKKIASEKIPVISDKAIQKNREDMNLCNEAQGVVGKNINLSLPTKKKDNTVPFNAQLDDFRKKDVSYGITETKMNKKEVSFGEKTEGIMPINIETEKFHQEKLKKYKKAEEKTKKDTDFWDKYVGLQMEGPTTTVNKNIPKSTSQLPNNPERFKDKNIDKMVMASLKDADAMLLHIYASAFSENRELTEKEKQQIVDINSGKMRLLGQKMVSPIRRNLEYASDPIIRTENGKSVVYEPNGTKIDEFKDCNEAKANYPEADIQKDVIASVKKAQINSDMSEGIGENQVRRSQSSQRYRLLFPIDVFYTSSGDPEKDKEDIYQEVKKVLSNGFSQSIFEGYNDYLQLGDIKTYDEVMRENGL